MRIPLKIAFAVLAPAYLACGVAACQDQRNADEALNVIQRRLEADYSTVGIRTGTWILSEALLKHYRVLESGDLVRLREVPQLGVSAYELTATPKLLAVAEPLLAGSDSSPGQKVLSIKAHVVTIDRIVAREEYKGSLANAGERHELILGMYSLAPTEAGRALGGPVLRSSVAQQERTAFQFRCIVKQSPFTKQAKVVAIDVGQGDSWFTNDVKQ